MKYGLVFRIKDEIFLAEYKDGQIDEGQSITDDKHVYDNLNANQCSLVEIESFQQDVMALRDLKRISVTCDGDPNATFHDFLLAGGGPEFAAQVYKEIK